MILVKALRQLISPNSCSSDFIPVTPFRNQKIAIAKQIFLNFFLWHLNLLYLI